MDVTVLDRSQRLLKDAGVTVTANELARMLEEALAELLPPELTASPERELPPGDRAALERMGLAARDRATGVKDPVARTAADYVALMSGALTVSEVASRLGVDARRVRQRLAERTVYGIRQSSGWRMPVFQFDANGLVPNIDRVFPRLDADLHPVEVWRWFVHPDPDLSVDDDETPVSPLHWLRNGRDPRPVIELAAAL